MDRDKLKLIMLDQRSSFLSEKELTDREIDIDNYIKSKQIVLISGIRRNRKVISVISHKK